MKREIIQHGKWLSLGRIHWQTPGGQTAQWEFATRENCEGAVCVLAYLPDANGKPAELIVVKQYRPPIDSHILELPAGLIDPGSTPEATALKELREETGYHGELQHLGPPIYNSPGMTDEYVHCALVAITGKTQQDLQDNEAIEVLHLPIKELRQALNKHEAEGIKIDAKLWSIAEGLMLL